MQFTVVDPIGKSARFIEQVVLSGFWPPRVSGGWKLIRHAPSINRAPRKPSLQVMVGASGGGEVGGVGGWAYCNHRQIRAPPPCKTVNAGPYPGSNKTHIGSFDCTKRAHQPALARWNS